MRTDKKIKLSIISGISAALFWTIADMLLVGFVPNTEKYKSFINVLPKDTPGLNHLTILMLEGTNERLMLGVYLATFSVFLYLLSTYAIYKLLPRKRISTIAVLALFIGYATSPVGHTAFAYIGLLSKNMQTLNPDVVSSQLMLLEQFKHLLNVHMYISVFFTALGFLIILFQILTKQFATRWASLLNPLVTGISIMSIGSLFPNSLIAVLFGCAGFNFSQLIFFIYLYYFYRTRVKLDQKDFVK